MPPQPPSTLALIHLGDSVPLYFRDCVHQLRLWNSPNTLTITAILDPVHRGAPFWEDVARTYAVRYVYTDELTPTEHHARFQATFHGDLAFRRGYWRHVQERFFFLEELMGRDTIPAMIAMEYDVLCYADLDILLSRLQAYTQRLAFVMDNDTRGHPGFLYVPSHAALLSFNEYIAENAAAGSQSDMTLFASYAHEFPERVSFLPLITPERNASRTPRQSLDEQHTAESAPYLSEGFAELQCLFDSAVVGQYVGGIDPRNTCGLKTVGYLNEGALYSLREMPLGFARSAERNLWYPTLDKQPLVTIHMHSKALSCYLSDRPDAPRPDYDVAAVNAMLEPN